MQAKKAQNRTETRLQDPSKSHSPHAEASPASHGTSLPLAPDAVANGDELFATLFAPKLGGTRQVFESIANGITIAEIRADDMVLVYINPAFEKLTGYAFSDVQGQNCRFLQGTETTQPALDVLRKALKERREVRTVLKNFKKDGTPFWNELYLSPIKDAAGQVTHYLGIQNDVTGKVELEAKMAHMAHHDMLTGLPNRTLLIDRMEQALLRAGRSRKTLAILFLDLDEFKTINDMFGHEAGDSLLKVVAARLSSVLRKYDTAARLGGDEFIVLLEEATDEQEAMRIKERLASEVGQPVPLSQGTFHPSVSIGMAIYPRDGSSAQELLGAADMSMYLAKLSRRERADDPSHAASRHDSASSEPDDLATGSPATPEKIDSAT